MRIRIKQLMAERGMSQGELSRRSGVDRPYISRLVNGKIPNPGVKSLAPIAAALDTTVDELFVSDEAA